MSIIFIIFERNYKTLIDMKIGIIDLCKQIDDPRMDRKKVHKMETIIYISIAAVICGAQSWNEIEEFGKSKFDFFKKRIPDLESIPSHDTFNRLFSIIKPDYFELIFRNWVKQVCQEIDGVVAIDGKLMRGPSRCDEKHTTGKDGFKLWMVSAWSASNGISLGQVKVNDKSNEITAVPLLINALDIEECIVTIDAMGCQTEITEAIRARKADYIIALKKNQEISYDLAQEIIGGYEYRDPILNRVTRHVSENDGHGRIETRTCTVVSYGETTESMFKDKFKDLKSIIGVKSERIIKKTGESTVEYRYYITSLKNIDPEKISSYIRQHWSIENNLHWQLDVTFKEDHSKKVKNAARNFSAVTKIALSVLKKDKTTKGSMNLKRLKAGWDDNYLSTLLKDNLF